MSHFTNRSIQMFYRGLCAGLLLAGAGGAQVTFTDVSEELGVELSTSYGVIAVAFADYDNDGHPEVALKGGTGPEFYLLNNAGNGRFLDRTVAIETNVGRARSMSFGDYDNDGDLDLFLGTSWIRLNVLLNNDQGIFKDITVKTGLTDTLGTFNAIWLDYDRDGFIDLYAGNVNPDDPARYNILYRNNGNGTFADMTEEVGLNMQIEACCGGSSSGMVSADFNNDGWPDLYVGADDPVSSNRLFLSDGQGRFRDATSSEITALGGYASGMAVGDIDNDGDLELFQASGGGITDVRTAPFRSAMLLNLGDGLFLDATEGVGLGALAQQSMEYPGMGDLDNDGDLDLVIANQRFVFLNNGDGTFKDATAQSRIAPAAFGLNALALGDYNGDGFLDIWAQATLARNNGNNHHWLRVELVGVASNRNGIGTRLTATAGGLRQVREVLGGGGRGQDEMVVHFGLGMLTQVDRLEVRWPSGQIDVLTDIPADRKVRVFEGRTDYQVVRPTTSRDFPAFLVAGATMEVRGAVQPALFERDAKIIRVVADLSELGGQPEVPLVDRGDGTYQLQTTLMVDSPRGLRNLPVLIEQTTSLGHYWTGLTKTTVVAPSEDLSIWTDANADNWVYLSELGTNLSNNPTLDFFPFWSPDGKKIVFQSDRNDGDNEIYVMDPDGGNPANLTNRAGADGLPNWSPDGTTIAFWALTGLYGTSEIHMMRYADRSTWAITSDSTNDWRGGWSPDGTKISFETDRDGNSEVYVMNIDGSDPVNLTNHPGWDGRSHWSPDGRRIAFPSDRDGNPDIYVMDADGNNPTNLTNHPATETYPVWSPDGRRIAFFTDRDGNDEVYVMDADGSNPVNVTNHPGTDGWASWSPDGRKIVFVSLRDGNAEIYAIDLSGSTGVRLDPEERETVYQGQTALEIQADGEWEVGFRPAATFGTEGYRALHFAFHPGEVQPSEKNAFSVSLEWPTPDRPEVGLIGGRLENVGVDMAKRDWQVVEIPLEVFGKLQPISEVRFSGNLVGTFYLDDVRLVAFQAGDTPNTAILEEHTAFLPDAFTLEQNYPNPFNSSTVIRFALPESGEVKLAVFNLAGQRVATLVEGVREAGGYTVSWDGRDDNRRELATSVYLLRLLTDRKQEETRKLLLLR